MACQGVVIHQMITIWAVEGIIEQPTARMKYLEAGL